MASKTPAKPVRVLDPAGARITILGCGGTGGFVAKNVCRQLYGIKHRDRAAHHATPIFGAVPPDRVPTLLLVDGDTVELKNTLRQDFMPADAGRPKALAMAERYSAAYGLDIRAYPRYLTPETDLSEIIPNGSIVVGCVDNAPTRRLLHEKLGDFEDVVYVDSGNGGVELPEEGAPLSREELLGIRAAGWSGQVACGVVRGGERIVPFPADVMPDLIEAAPGDLLPTEVPCGQVMASLPQRQMTNLLAATIIMQYLTTLISDGTLLHHLSYFDARRGYVRSNPAIEVLDEVAV